MPEDILQHFGMTILTETYLLEPQTIKSFCSSHILASKGDIGYNPTSNETMVLPLQSHAQRK